MSTPDLNAEPRLFGLVNVYNFNLAMFAVLAAIFYFFNGKWVPQAFVLVLFALNLVNVRFLLGIRRVTAISVPLTITALLTLATFAANKSGGPAAVVQFFNLFVVMNIMLMGPVLMRDPHWSRLLAVWAVIAAASAIASIADHLVSGQSIFTRLIPLGRSGNSIPGAGGLAVGMIAALALLFDHGIKKYRPVLWAAVIACATGVLMTQSRTPIAAACVAIGCLFVFRQKVWRWPFYIGAALWLVLSAAIIFEDSIKSLICTTGDLMCRPSYRQAAWGWVRDTIVQNPWFGVTPLHRFADALAQHPHNGIFGLTMFYGIPTAIAFVTFLYAAGRVERDAPAGIANFSAAMLVFAMGYMATDLSNAFSFANMHLYFMWLPISLGVAHIWRRDTAAA